MRGHDLFRYIAVASFLFCYVTILLGGNVMASDSGLACPDWPTCHGSLAPPISGSTGIEWTHRIAAFVLSSAIGLLTFLAVAYERRRPVILRLTGLAFATVVGQALLGGLVVESGLTVGLVLLHLALATALFAVLLVLVLLANLREVPQRWLEWARRASDEREPSDAEISPSPTPLPTGSRF